LQNEQVLLKRKALYQIEKEAFSAPIVALNNAKGGTSIGDAINVAQNGIYLLLASNLNVMEPDFRNQSRLKGLKDRISLTPFYGHSV
jgi:hypothetical protein